MVISEEKYIMSIDSGGSGIRAMLFNKKGEIIAREYKKTPPITELEGAIEHDPEELWQALLEVSTKIFASNQFNPVSIAALGICNQRASFCLWEKATGKPVTNLISWADVRAASTAEKMNHNFKYRMLKSVAKVVGRITGDVMLNVTAMLKIIPAHCTARLKWVLDNDPELKKRCFDGEILFGTLDTWFIYKLTRGNCHYTDYTNASTSSLYNHFQFKWNDIFGKLFNLPMNILPEVKPTNGDFGMVEKSVFGAEIPIRAAVGDQMAALFGQCCFTPGDVKISQGSGAFVDMNVGSKPKLSKKGLFPLLAWYIDDQPTYMIEGLVSTAGTLIDWLGSGIGLADTPAILNEFASQTQDTEGVVFIPTPNGISFPYFNARAKASVLGLSLSTHRRHLARAVLEGIAMRLYEIMEGIEKDTKTPIRKIKVDGGVSKSDILLQILSDFAKVEVLRAPESDMTSTGAAYLAGLGVGFWKDLDELKALAQNYSQFSPMMEETLRLRKINRWKKAVKLSLNLEK